MQCLTFNARSLVNKLDALTTVLVSILVTETWLHDGVTNALLDPYNNYQLIRKDRDHNKGGGACVFVKRCWTVVTVSFEPSELEMVCFDLIGHHRRVHLFIYLYMKPTHKTT